MQNPVRLVANLSLMFTEFDILDRPHAARAAGFDEVEFWWPFGANGRPAEQQVADFIDSVRDSGVRLIAMNLFGGDMAGGERGVLSYPEREREFLDSVEIAVEVGRSLGTRLFNAPYGHRRNDLEITKQDNQADRMLTAAAEAMATIDGMIMIEALSGMPAYPIKTTADAVAIIDRVESHTSSANLGLLIDQFHVAMNDGDPIADVQAYCGRLSHTQIADTPGRGEPYSGTANIIGFIDALLDKRYSGAVALEYAPTTTTTDSLATFAEKWAARWRLSGYYGSTW